MSDFHLALSLFVPSVAGLIAPRNLLDVCALLLTSRDDLSLDICGLIRLKWPFLSLINLLTDVRVYSGRELQSAAPERFGSEEEHRCSSSHLRAHPSNSRDFIHFCFLFLLLQSLLWMNLIQDEGVSSPASPASSSLLFGCSGSTDRF